MQTPPSDDDPAAALAVGFLVHASAYRHGGRATGYEFHKGACKATLWALKLLAEQFPHALQVAVERLNEHVDQPPVFASKFRTADAAKIAEQLLANLRRGAEHFYDGVLPVDFNGQEAVDRAHKAHRASKGLHPADTDAPPPPAQAPSAPAAHTPGPWQWDANQYTLRPAKPDPERFAVHTILHAHGGAGFLASKPAETRAELEADLALIATAPELFSALQRLHSMCLGMDAELPGNRPAEADYQGAMWAAEVALAKAAAPVQP